MRRVAEILPSVHVVLTKEQLDPTRLRGRVVVVLDVLFATTSALAALQAGATEVLPARDAAHARSLAASRDPATTVLSGELDADTLPGFAAPTPLALLQQPLRGTSLIYSTTNGTVALDRAAGADAVYAASLRNAAATVAHLRLHHAHSPLLLLCAGTNAAVNLEDLYGAGLLVGYLQAAGAGWRYSDAALAAAALCRGSDALTSLRTSAVGRLMLERGLDDEVAYAAAVDADALVALLQQGRLLRI